MLSVIAEFEWLLAEYKSPNKCANPSCRASRFLPANRLEPRVAVPFLPVYSNGVLWVDRQTIGAILHALNTEISPGVTAAGYICPPVPLRKLIGEERGRQAIAKPWNNINLSSSSGRPEDTIQVSVARACHELFRATEQWSELEASSHHEFLHQLALMLGPMPSAVAGSRRRHRQPPSPSLASAPLLCANGAAPEPATNNGYGSERLATRTVAGNSGFGRYR